MYGILTGSWLEKYQYSIELRIFMQYFKTKLPFVDMDIRHFKKTAWKGTAMQHRSSTGKEQRRNTERPHRRRTGRQTTQEENKVAGVFQRSGHAPELS